MADKIVYKRLAKVQPKKIRIGYGTSKVSSSKRSHEPMKWASTIQYAYPFTNDYCN